MTLRYRLRYRLITCVLVLLALMGCRATTPPPTGTTSLPTASVDGIAFEEVAGRSGLNFHWREQRKPERNLEAFGCGCAFIDYDNDGWPDILLVSKPHPTLYRNRHDGTFSDVTATTGLDAVRGDWKGCAVGDFDGDGYLDIVLTGYHCLALLRNQGGRRWRDVTQVAGLDPHDHNHWGTSAGFMDLDGTGRLDLVLGHYVVFGPHQKQFCTFMGGVTTGCPPATYKPEFPELWQNLGNGRFKNITAESGLNAAHGKALVFAFADVDDDGRIDFYIGNDGLPADLMHNLGHLRFQNLGIRSGVAYGQIPGRAIAAMGPDFADYDGDGRPDLVVTAFSDEPYSVLRNLGHNQFEHVSDQVGISGPTLKPLGFGAKWIDVDNDGWTDIVFVNGHVYDRAGDLDPLSPWRQPLMLFHNIPATNGRGRKFLDIAPRLGGGFTTPIVGRGGATADYDNDGRMDFLAVDYEGAPVLLHNVSHTHNHWITFDLRGRGPNRFAYGARVTAEAGKRVWAAAVSPTSSYLSSSDPRVHFGLGTVANLDRVTIRWPDGTRQILPHVGVDRILVVTQGGARPASVGASTALPPPTSR